MGGVFKSKGEQDDLKKEHFDFCTAIFNSVTFIDGLSGGVCGVERKFPDSHVKCNIWSITCNDDDIKSEDLSSINE